MRVSPMPKPLKKRKPGVPMAFRRWEKPPEEIFDRREIRKKQRERGREVGRKTGEFLRKRRRAFQQEVEERVDK